jgi:hypothetical protein
MTLSWPGNWLSKRRSCIRRRFGDADLHAPLLQIITNRISALVEELRWEVAAVRWAEPKNDT